MTTDARLDLLLALADDELILGHRLSEWTGWVPYVEEDLALSSIAQDEIAHARALYEIAATIDPRDVDALALGRSPAEYRCCRLVEHPNRDFAYTIARQWLYDTADDVRLTALAESSFKELRELVAIMRMEERYHLEHAETWVRRMSEGPVDARRRFADALEETLAEAAGIFEPILHEDALIDDGTLPVDHDTLRARWLDRVQTTLASVGLDHLLRAHERESTGEFVPTSAGAIEAGEQRVVETALGADGAGGRRGEHSEDFPPLWEEMTALYRAHPGARW